MAKNTKRGDGNSGTGKKTSTSDFGKINYSDLPF